MKKISLMVMIGMMACGLLVTHATVKGGGGKAPKMPDRTSMLSDTKSMVLDKSSMVMDNDSMIPDTVSVDMRKISYANSLLETSDSAASDTAVDVVAYFCKGDTCEYWISEGKWKVNGKDTVKLTDVATKVRLVVTDSTKNGYKMTYTFLDTRMDSVGPTLENKMMEKIMERSSKSLIGTTVEFETDELGAITKITNLAQIRKQAKALFKASMQEIASMPAVKELKKIGMDLEKTASKASVDAVVDGYLEELKMLFMGHGNHYPVGEKHEHEDATDEDLESDTYLTADYGEDGTYSMSMEVTQVVPKSYVKELTGAVMDGIMDGLKDMKDEDGKKLIDKDGKIQAGKDGKMEVSEIKEQLNKQLDHDMLITEYMSWTYFDDGWPYRVVSQNKRMVGEVGKVNQTFIELCRFAQRKK